MGVTRRLQPLRGSVAADLVRRSPRSARCMIAASASLGFLIQIVVSYHEARRSCATPPAIPGTAARWNGRPRRRRRPTTSPSRRSRARHRRLVRHEEPRLRSGRSSGFRPIHMPQEHRRRRDPVGDSALVLGFAHDLAHWWLAAIGVRGADRRRRSVTPSTTTATTTSPPTRSPAPKPRAPTLLAAQEPDMASDQRRRHRRPPPTLLPDRAGRSRPRRKRHAAGLLALPDERLPDLRCLFATYRACWAAAMPAGPRRAELFDLPLVALNTALLLLSSITYGFAMLEMQRQRGRRHALVAGVTACWAPASSASSCTSSRT